MAVRTTVMVLNYNGRRHLEACLASLAQLDVFASGSPGVARDPARPDDVWLVDNASTDGSVEYVKSQFPWVRVVESDTNLGFSRAYNRASAMAGSRFVAFLNNDMRVEEGWLSALHRTRGAHPEAKFVAGRIMSWDRTRLDFAGADTFFTGHAWQRRLGEKVVESEFVEAPLLFGCAGSLLAEREPFLDIGGFDPDYFSFFEDVDLGWRATLLGLPTWFAPASVARHKRHGSWAGRSQLWVRFLAERNALFTAFKNFGGERAGVLLLVNAALTFLRGWWCGARCEGQTPALSGTSIAHLLALADLVEHMPDVRERRARVQAGRVRGDGEVLPLFGALAAPPTALGAQYRDALRRWTTLAGIRADSFGGPWPGAINDAAEDAALRLAELCAAQVGEAFPVEQFVEAGWEPEWEHPVPQRAAAALAGAHGALVRFVASGIGADALATLSDELRQVHREAEQPHAAPSVRRLGAAAVSNDQRPSVSVVIRTKDRLHELRQALASVASQRYPNLEVVVVNDGGTSPAPVVDEFAPAFPIVLVDHPREIGRSAAAQAGLEAASGEFVNFLDDDDELLPFHLDTLTAAVVREGARVAYADVACVGDGGGSGNEPDGLPATILGGEPDLSSLRFENTIPIMAVLMDRQLALSVGGFDPSLLYFEDWDLWLRLAARTPFHHCPRVTATYHVRPALAQGGGIGGPLRWAALARLFDRHRTSVRGADWARFYQRRLEPARARLAEVESRSAARDREIAARDRQIADLGRTLAVIERSRGWRVVQLVRHLLGRR